VRECPPWLLGKVLASIRRRRAEMPVPGLGKGAEVAATRHARTQELLADVVRKRAEIDAVVAEGRGAGLEVFLVIDSVRERSSDAISSALTCA